MQILYRRNPAWGNRNTAKLRLRPALRMAATLLFLLAGQNQVVAAQCVDPDGDGWGWDGQSSCRIDQGSTTDPAASAGACVDTDGDGWGWDGESSCRLDQQSTDEGGSQTDTCVDADGDGWGWNGESSCRPGEQTDQGGESIGLVCVDTDGDGWGWDGQASCQVSDTAGNPGLNSVAADTLLKRGLKAAYGTALDGSATNSGGVFVDFLEADAATGTGTGAADDSAGVDFSGTNLQETGVDEFDRIKVDGNVMFALDDRRASYDYAEPGIATDSSLPFWPDQQAASLSAWRLNGDNSSLLSRQNLDLDGRTPDGIYLHNGAAGRQVVVLASNGFSPWESWFYPQSWAGQTTSVSWLNAVDPANLAISRTLELEGALISSRKIGSRLILVTRYHPQLPPQLVPYPQNDTEVQSNVSIIDNLSTDELLPGYTLSSGSNTATAPLIVDNQCHQASADASVEASLISIITIDLDSTDPRPVSSCFIGATETLYVSTESLYLATTRYDYGYVYNGIGDVVVDYYPPQINTDIHKFAFAGSSVAYRGSGTVAGHLGHQPDRKPFRMSELNDNLRVVTFGDDQSSSPVVLSVLREGSGATLSTVATLPNAARPEAIGKPGENLYASRFLGNRAYLVTFRVVDPLYILDLSDPADPFIAGELELPGYSDYLHLVNENLLLGVGKDAIAADSSAWGDGRGAWYQGVKLALFDVSDAANPGLADSLVFGKRGTDTPALYQHHSFSWLAGNGTRNPRMAMSLALHDGQQYGNGPASWADWTADQLIKVEVDEASQSLISLPSWVLQSSADNFYSNDLGNDRTVLGTDASVYLMHANKLYFGQWGASSPSAIVE